MGINDVSSQVANSTPNWFKVEFSKLYNDKICYFNKRSKESIYLNEVFWMTRTKGVFTQYSCTL